MKKRRFWEIDDVELNAAVAAMCDGLGVSGSVTPLYDLYSAVLGEKRKAAEWVDRWEGMTGNRPTLGGGDD